MVEEIREKFHRNHLIEPNLISIKEHLHKLVQKFGESKLKGTCFEQEIKGNEIKYMD